MKTARLVASALLIAALSACLTDESTENEGRPPGGDRFVIVHLTDDGMELASEVVAGTVSFEIENNGAREHGFAIEGPGVSERIEGLRRHLPELPWQRRSRFIEQYGLPPADALLLTGERALYRVESDAPLRPGERT